MTAQTPERLRLDGEMTSLCTNPLSQYFDRVEITSPFDGERSTSLWRGYVGTWEIVQDYLYLIDLNGYLRDSDAPVTLETLFPGFPERVWAHWYTGELRIPQGGLLEYHHMGYSSRHERDLFISVRHGRVTGRRVQHNGVADPGAPQGYGVAASTVHGRRPLRSPAS